MGGRVKRRRVRGIKRLTNMLTKLPLFICLAACSGFCQAQEEELPIDLIELLGEFNEDEIQTLEEAISEVESLKFEDSQPMLDAGASYNGTTHEYSAQ